MKKVSLAATFTALTLVLSPSLVEAGLTLSGGQSFEYEFSSIFSTTPFSDDPFVFAGFSVSGDILTDGEALIFAVFEDSTDQVPIRSGTFEGVSTVPSGGGLGGGGFLTSVALAPWQDLQGIFKVEVTSGTIELSSFNAATVIGGDYYEQTYVIPEPNSVSLLLLGTGIFYLRRKRFSNQPSGVARQQ